MAWTASGLYVVHWMRTLGGDAKTYVNRYLIDLSSTNNTVALYDNTVTPNFSGTTGNVWAAYTTSGEASGTGYTATGQALTAGYSQTVTDVTGTLKYTHNAITWATATITANGALWYNAAVTAGDTGSVAKPCFVGVSFGGTYTSTAGNFVVTPSGSGVFTIDLTP